MGRDNNLYITVPTLFRCPISLDIMKSPVSLCTGVTYDRSSIQRWLDSGNNTCPATMQVLETKEIVPNHTLQRLIQIWSDNSTSPQPHQQQPLTTTLDQNQVLHLVNQIERTTHAGEYDSCITHLTKLISFATGSDQNRKFLATVDGFVVMLIKCLGSRNLHLSEKIVQLCSLVFQENQEAAAQFGKSVLMDKNMLAFMLILLQKECLNTRITVLGILAVDLGSKILIAEQSEILTEILSKLGADLENGNEVEANLSFLVSIAMPKRVRLKIVHLGAVKIFKKMLMNSHLKVSAVEKVLKLLEMVSTCKEGRSEICDDGDCVKAIVMKVLKVSSGATEHAVTIVWSLCCLFRDQKAQEAVMKSNGMGKILVLIQSNCSPAVRQMCGDLLKIFRVCSKSCLSSYETKTTHIMPF